MKNASQIPTLVLAGNNDNAMGLEVLRRGAKDYLLERHIETYSFVRAIRNMERKTGEETLFTGKERAQVTLNPLHQKSRDVVVTLPLSRLINRCV